MAITIKSEREIELMAEAGKILERVHNELEKALHPGMSTKDIDTLGEKIIRSYGCIPSFLNYNGYPASICVSVNQEVVHGIPDKHRIIHEGDIVSLDAGVIYKGYHSDAARTHAVGNISEEAKRLIGSHREALDKIAVYLIRRETITGKEFMKIFREVKGLPEEKKEDGEGIPDTEHLEKEDAAESPETAVAEEKENEAGAENIVADASEEKPDQSGEDQQV